MKKIITYIVISAVVVGSFVVFSGRTPSQKVQEVSVLTEKLKCQTLGGEFYIWDKYDPFYFADETWEKDARYKIGCYTGGGHVETEEGTLYKKTVTEFEYQI